MTDIHIIGEVAAPGARGVVPGLRRNEPPSELDA